jgi:hypothetical protein
VICRLVSRHAAENAQQSLYSNWQGVSILWKNGTVTLLPTLKSGLWKMEFHEKQSWFSPVNAVLFLATLFVLLEIALWTSRWQQESKSDMRIAYVSISYLFCEFYIGFKKKCTFCI